MNKIYKVVWSKAKHCYVVASELAKRTSKGSGARSLTRAAVTLGVVATLMGGTAEAAIESKEAVTGVTVKEDLVTASGTASVVNGITSVETNTGEFITAIDPSVTTGEAITAVGTVNTSTVEAVTGVTVNTNGVTTGKADFLTGTSADATKLNNTIKNTGGITRDETNEATSIEGVMTVTGGETKSVVINSDVDNKVTIDTKGISVGTNGIAVDKDGIYAGGANYNDAIAAIGADGKIKGADGNFEVDTDGTTTIGTDDNYKITLNATEGSITTTGNAKIGKNFTVTATDGSMSAAGGNFTVADDGTIAVATNKFTVNKDGNTVAAGTLNVAKATTLQDTLTVEKDSTLKGNLTVEKDSTLKGNLTVEKDSTLKGNLTVDKDSTLKGNVTIGTADANANLEVNGATTVRGGDFSVYAEGGDFPSFKVTASDGSVSAADGNFTVKGDGSIAVAKDKFTVDASGNTSAAGTLEVTGATTLKDKLDVTGATTLGDTLTVEGDTELKSNLKVGGEALFNEGKTNQIKIDESGIRIGLHSGQVDDQGFYAGGHTWDEAKAAIGADGRIKGEAFMVNNKTYIDKDGLNANNQKIRNVAPGDISPTSTDATIGRQLYEVREELQADINRVGAGAAAMANLRPLDMGNKFSMAMGVGSYRSKTAMAMGLFYKPSDRVAFNVSGTVGNGHNMIGAGVSFALDKVVKPVGGAAAQAEIQNLKAENAEIKAELAELKAMIASMKAAK